MYGRAVFELGLDLKGPVLTYSFSRGDRKVKAAPLPRRLRRQQILSCKNRPDNTCLKGIYSAILAKHFAVIGQRILSKYSQRLGETLTSPSSSYCRKIPAGFWEQQAAFLPAFLCVAAIPWSACLQLIRILTAAEERRT